EENELVNSFLQKLMNMDYTARDTVIKLKQKDKELKTTGTKKACDKEVADYNPDIHPMDVQMAVFHCADGFLKQMMVTKLSQCQYALPLLVPDPFTQQIEFPLWTFRQISKSWKMKNSNNEIISQTQPVYKAETPMVAFFRFGSVSSSKSQLMNSLIKEKHHTFFHRNCSGGSRTRLLLDGVVEIAWYCPSGKKTDTYNDCVAFCNLYGDAGVSETQYEILTSMASVNVLFLPDFGQKNLYKGLVRSLFKSHQPLICLLTDNDCDKTKLRNRKFIMGLLNKNQSDVSEQIKENIRESLTKQKKSFKLEDVAKHTGLRVDENDPECQRGKQAADQIMGLLRGKDPSTVKETFLPCQGKLWHDWCKMNKELHHLQRENPEEDKTRKEKIMRDIRQKQIYESWSSVKKNKKDDLQFDFCSLPSLAAEMMISGFPMELMDGDAAHVPLTWITAVLDELVKKLGDQKVFVLSVLGIQSSGKSTMLNAMFGLQFAVSAGRCTRGAFMQLIKVSKEMKTELKFDYILVVDTEGLRPPELAESSTTHRDNEMATFVVGVGNMTLINIFGENPSEMQDILQIVVQAFMRMKKVRLNPSCMFVHQNVSDITAEEKNLEGRRRLQEKLDEMTKLAAREEDFDAERFSDVIVFDVQNDVKYFAQLWEGSPPMAPPNPDYCENILELKQTILTHASKSEGITLTHLRDRIQDLWEALLNEQFVFSFKNSLEIATYKKLETEYSKWTWSLRSAMLEIESKLHNKIENKTIHHLEETDVQYQLNARSEEVKKTMEANDPVLYFERKSEEYYGIFQKYCQGASSTAIFGAFVCNKLKEPIQQNVYKKTARDLANEMRTNCESLNGNRSNLEKHILRTLAEKQDFNAYMTYINNPREHFKNFIRSEVSQYITKRFEDSVRAKMEDSILLLKQQITNAAHESSQEDNVKLWLSHFTQELSDVLVFSSSDLTGVNQDDVEVSFLEAVIKKELPSVISDIISKFSTETFPVKLEHKDRPDEILTDHFCQCCWVQCPFCAAICTNTIENHDGDHSVPFHRIIGVNGCCYRGTTSLSISICTSAVASDRSFFPNSSDDKVPWKEYRKGGPEYASWSITPDLSELPYWKWFVCRFQKDLENHYKKTLRGFQRKSVNLDEWRKYLQEDAIKSLDKYI
ncbi:hypothetical protein M9458_045676, partial [Cirrhinus mrigala]